MDVLCALDDTNDSSCDFDAESVLVVGLIWLVFVVDVDDSVGILRIIFG